MQGVSSGFNRLTRPFLATPLRSGVTLAAIAGLSQTLALVGVDNYISTPEQAWAPPFTVACAFTTGYFGQKVLRQHIRVKGDDWTEEMRWDGVKFLCSYMMFAAMAFCSLIVIQEHIQN